MAGAVAVCYYPERLSSLARLGLAGFAADSKAAADPVAAHPDAVKQLALEPVFAACSADIAAAGIAYCAC